MVNLLSLRYVPARALPVLVLLMKHPFQFRFQTTFSKLIQHQLPECQIPIAGKRCLGDLQYPLHSGSNQIQDGFESDHWPCAYSSSSISSPSSSRISSTHATISARDSSPVNFR